MRSDRAASRAGGFRSRRRPSASKVPTRGWIGQSVAYPNRRLPSRLHDQGHRVDRARLADRPSHRGLPQNLIAASHPVRGSTYGAKPCVESRFKATAKGSKPCGKPERNIVEPYAAGRLDEEALAPRPQRTRTMSNTRWIPQCANCLDDWWKTG